MLDIIKFVADIFSSLYHALDVKIFPDINLSLIQIIIGIVLFGIIIKFMFTLGGTSNFSIGNTIRGMLDDTREKRSNLVAFKGYTPKHSKDGYTPRHGKR